MPIFQKCLQKKKKLYINPKKKKKKTSLFGFELSSLDSVGCAVRAEPN